MRKKLTDWNLLLCVALLDLNLAGSCSTGWFGPDCSFMCHCSNNSPCDITTGECSPGVSCGKGFFGPGCQFVDLLAEIGSLENPEFLVNGIKSSCNPDPKASSLTVSLNHSSNIYWFRIYTDVDMSNCCMSVLLDNQTCQDFKMYRVSEKILDVTCNSPFLVTQLLINGPVAGHTCDLEISGGQNVALKQIAAQSSTFFDNKNGKSLSGNAVDGNRNTEFLDGSCSHTENSEENPEWSLVLKKNEKIFRIVIYNRNQLRYRLDGFILEVYSKIDEQTVHNETSKVSASAIYFVNLPPNLPSVKKIVIKKNFDYRKKENYLTLCEVELYKQHFCDQGFFGLYCNQSCSCEANRQCHPSTGVCGTPCVTGKNDLRCAYTCHPNCKDNKCLDGMCVSCKEGFKGAYCEEAESPNIVDICPAGKYGTNCTLNCHMNCLDMKCNKTTGDCLACVRKQLLPLCDKEPDDDGVNGLFSYLYWLVLLLLLIPLCVLFIFCLRRLRKKPVEEEKTTQQPPMEQRPKELEESEDNASYLEEIMEKGSSVDASSATS